MTVALFKGERSLCAECSIAIRRFIGGIEGVDSIDVESGKIAVKFDDAEINEEKIKKITRDNIERLGYRVEE